jgi:hypothetical protein
VVDDDKSNLAEEGDKFEKSDKVEGGNSVVRMNCRGPYTGTTMSF